MKTFITDDFLLTNTYAKQLYHQYAVSLPIIDYHCHLSPKDIAENRSFNTITEIWLAGDHYKWRAMRTLGVDEKFITGSADDEAKFQKWAATVPYTVRNPLYHWTHLELLRYFGIDDLLNSETATKVYATANGQLRQPVFSTRGLLAKMNVEVVCTTDDPADDLQYHADIRESDTATMVLPTFRPDKVYAVDDAPAFKEYIGKLGAVAGVSIDRYDALMDAIEKRIDFFHSQGCRLSDHGIEQLTYPAERFKIEDLFSRVQSGKTLGPAEQEHFKYHTLLLLSRMYHARGWTQQFHLGALRNNSSKMMKRLGPDTGFDSIGDFSQAKAMARFLNELDSTDQLSKTILYNLNPADNEVFASMPGNFNDGSVKGKIQFGSAWWFLDQKDGMEKQLNALSNLGLLSCFIGMLTDSRSFLSYPRHEYFRRILCNLIGKDVQNGELPWDEKWLGQIVSDICYHNAHQYFNFSSIRQTSFSHA